MTEQIRKIGYGHPPLHSRFKPGQSGNPSGRPKNSKRLDIRADVLKQFLQEFPVIENGRKRHVPAIILIIRTLVVEAIRGDKKSAVLALKFAETQGVMNIKDELEVDLSKLTPEQRRKCAEAFQFVRSASYVKRKEIQ